MSAAARIWTLPNVLTMGRIAAALLLPLVLLIAPAGGAALWCLILFALAAFTDFLDGWLARRLDLTSRFGAMLDPIGDKVLLASGLVCLFVLDAQAPQELGGLRLSAWLALPASLLLGREFIVAGVREYTALSGQRISVTGGAKLKTVLQFAGLCALMAAYAGPTLWLYTAGLALLLASMVLSLLSGADYIRKGIALMKETR
ncbi:MAG: CDP-alcohol phosphatidyltransferase family protein [Neomegalonema sp.]|nr:CDP-alcohol phosphatidyltransferase family protein [Neomegalonema sp.]